MFKIRPLRVCSKSFTKTFYWNKFLVSGCICKLACHCESFRYRWKIFEQIVTVAYFKKQPPEVFCKRTCSWKFRKFYRKIPALESHFNKVAGLRETFWKRDSNTCIFSIEICEIFESTYFGEHLWTSAFVSSTNFIYNAWKRYS